MNRRTAGRSIGLAFAAVATCLSAQAAALTASTTDLVDGVALSTFSLDEETSTVLLGIDDCESFTARDDLALAVTFSIAEGVDLATQYDQVMYFSIPRGQTTSVVCSTGDTCSPIDPQDVLESSGVVEASIDFDTLTGFDTPASCTGVDNEYFVRIFLRNTIDDTSYGEQADARIIVDTVRPPAPLSFEATASESAIVVSWEPPSSTETLEYWVFFSTSLFATTDDSGVSKRLVTGTDNAGDVAVALNTEQPVYVALASRDEAGNFSNIDTPVQISVIQTTDFWEYYRQQGGTEEGGCSTTGVSGASSFGLIALMLLGLFGLRRRSPAILIGSAALSLLIAAPASAETPINGAFEMKFGNYYPAIDEEFSGVGPFETVFGTDSLFYGEFELDFYFFDKFGRAGAGFAFGYTSVEAPALTDSTDEVTDQTGFNVIPMRAHLIYRYDYSALHHHIPLVPVIKGGLDYYAWEVTDPTGETASFDSTNASGGKTGWHFSLGLHLLLDIIDSASAAALDMSWGVNNSYLFAEWMTTNIDGFGDPGFDLSADMYLFGLAFEF